MIRKINNIDYIFLICQRIVQPIGELYSTSISWDILRKIAFTNPRILMGIDENGKEEYSGIQRLLSPERKKEIAAYVNKDLSATFPSSIIINIPQQEVDAISINPTIQLDIVDDGQSDVPKNIPVGYNQSIQFPELFLFVFPFKENVAQIIDGQHRMSGFENSSEDLRFDLPVTIFVEQLIDKQAEIFSTINGKQTRVTPSLVYDLFGLSLKRSPYKVANEMVKLLNESDSSPIKNWIRILGKANDFYSGYITQSTVVKNLLLLYCGNIKQAEEDKRVLASGKKPTDKPSLTSRETVFRDLFINEEDEIIFKSLLNFYNAVKNTFSAEWDRQDTVLNKTVGFNALFKVFIVMAKKGRVNNSLSFDFFKKELEPSSNISFDGILLSSKGVNQLFERFIII
jgi:DGQHR domain-containing protein